MSRKLGTSVIVCVGVCIVGMLGGCDEDLLPFSPPVDHPLKTVAIYPKTQDLDLYGKLRRFFKAAASGRRVHLSMAGTMTSPMSDAFSPVAEQDDESTVTLYDGR